MPSASAAALTRFERLDSVREPEDLPYAIARDVAITSATYPSTLSQAIRDDAWVLGGLAVLATGSLLVGAHGPAILMGLAFIAEVTIAAQQAPHRAVNRLLRSLGVRRGARVRVFKRLRTAIGVFPGPPATRPAPSWILERLAPRVDELGWSREARGLRRARELDVDAALAALGAANSVRQGSAPVFATLALAQVGVAAYFYVWGGMASALFLLASASAFAWSAGQRRRVVERMLVRVGLPKAERRAVYKALKQSEREARKHRVALSARAQWIARRMVALLGDGEAQPGAKSG